MNISPETLGFLASLEGKGFFDNPFLRDSNEFRKWVDGYCGGITAPSYSYDANGSPV